ncbi:MAG: hypothetical protein ACRDPG_08250 [Nocardioidaceae bacterium]
MADWVTISSLATAGGTLVLALATFASVRSANRAARVAEESLLTGIRPLLMPSHAEDAPLKVGFGDDHLVLTPGGGGTAEYADNTVYLTMSIRNVGNGIAVLHGWQVAPERGTAQAAPPDVKDFRRLTRDIYVASGDVAFWQGAFRDPSEQGFVDVRRRIDSPERISVDLLYGDHQGGQRIISRFVLLPRSDGQRFAAVTRHWNLDRPGPR